MLNLTGRRSCVSAIHGEVSVVQLVWFSLVLLLLSLSHLTMYMGGAGDRWHSGGRWVTAGASTVEVSICLPGSLFCSAAY